VDGLQPPAPRAHGRARAQKMGGGQGLGPLGSVLVHDLVLHWGLNLQGSASVLG
jgi:hypothetical protein